MPPELVFSVLAELLNKLSAIGKGLCGVASLWVSAPGLLAYCPAVWCWGQTHLKATFPLSNTQYLTGWAKLFPWILLISRII